MGLGASLPPSSSSSSSRYNIEQEKKLAQETTVLVESYTVSNFPHLPLLFLTCLTPFSFPPPPPLSPPSYLMGVL